jgi:hypothetical protein
MIVLVMVIAVQSLGLVMAMKIVNLRHGAVTSPAMMMMEVIVVGGSRIHQSVFVCQVPVELVVLMVIVRVVVSIFTTVIHHIVEILVDVLQQVLALVYVLVMMVVVQICVIPGVGPTIPHPCKMMIL